MLKLTSLALGLLTVITIAPKSEAMSANVSPLSLQQPAGNLHSQVIIKLGGQPERYDRAEIRRRELEREREAARRRHQYHSHNRYDDRDKYHGEYHRDR
jgi:hypothetical protein